ncbi:hypothetical protein EBBID32_23230 [Sphingobium indicum BiD32]|uniref:Uncharacterized protein n=1 Tax=Sphingobium indicum BiD32 TaxID=1301087 RepID=N1MR97_9SPHN|nr:hypothetical protein EBBID32_23230 [Sphingobium indicum BiD32]
MDFRSLAGCAHDISPFERTDDDPPGAMGMIKRRRKLRGSTAR